MAEKNNFTEGNILQEYKTRIFWLVLGLIGSLAISKFIKNFETTLETNLLVAAFIPLVVYVSGAVGTQMESMIIRAIAKEKKFSFSKFFIKQFSIVLLLAITMGVLSGLSSWVIYNIPSLSLSLGISVFLSIMSSLITGLAIPYFFWTFHQDPAEASGPVGTIVQDILSIIIYLVVCSAFIL